MGLDNGVVLPLIVLLAGVGLALALERAWLWLRWHLLDAPLRQVETIGQLLAWLTGPRAEVSTPLRTMLHAIWQADAPVSPIHQGMVSDNAFDAALAKVETRVSTIGWLAGILPVLGLLGTVIGLTQSFEVLGKTTSREALAQGLSYALVTTQAGLLGALPLLAFHHLFERLIQHWQIHAQRLTKLLLMAKPEQL